MMFDVVNKSGDQSKLQEGDAYRTEEGFLVFTEKYHLRRGYCCKSGCRHCPYGYDKNTGRVLGAKKPKGK